jgi:hypothetical protein
MSIGFVFNFNFKEQNKLSPSQVMVMRFSKGSKKMQGKTFKEYIEVVKVIFQSVFLSKNILK